MAHRIGAGVVSLEKAQRIPPRCSYIIVEMYILCIFIVGYKFIFIDSRSVRCSFALFAYRFASRLLVGFAMRAWKYRSGWMGPFVASKLPRFCKREEGEGRMFDGGKLDLKITLFLRFCEFSSSRLAFSRQRPPVGWWHDAGLVLDPFVSHLRLAVSDVYKTMNIFTIWYLRTWKFSTLIVPRKPT